MASKKYPNNGRGGQGSKSPIPTIPPRKPTVYGGPPTTGRSGRTTPTPPTMGRSGKVASGMTPTTGRSGNTAKIPTVTSSVFKTEMRYGAAGPKSVPKTGRRGAAGTIPPTKGRGGKVGTGVTPTKGRSGKVGPVASVSPLVRKAEWKYRDAQHKANNRAKAAKNPNGRIAKAMAKRSQARYDKSGKYPK